MRCIQRDVPRSRTQHDLFSARLGSVIRQVHARFPRPKDHDASACELRLVLVVHRMEYRRRDAGVRFLRLVQDVLDPGDGGYGGGDVKAGTERDVVRDHHFCTGCTCSMCGSMYVEHVYAHRPPMQTR